MNPAIQNTTPVLMEGGTVRWHGLFAPAALDALERNCDALEQARLNSGASSIRAAHPVDVAPRERGSLVAFRASALHRVTPITRGRRKALVVWAAGPELR